MLEYFFRFKRSKTHDIGENYMGIAQTALNLMSNIQCGVSWGRYNVRALNVLFSFLRTEKLFQLQLGLLSSYCFVETVRSKEKNT